MSTFTDRLYSRWQVQNGSRDPLHLARSGYGAAPHVGAQRRSRPEGYPRDQARPQEGRRPDGRAGADPQGGGALTRPAAGSSASPTDALHCAPCKTGCSEQGVQG
jgi:hypothetical protein